MSVSARIGSSARSSSTHTTFPALAESSRVRQPTPAPISSTPVFSLSPADSAMSSGTHEAVRKFCPSDFEKRKPCRASRSCI